MRRYPRLIIHAPLLILILAFVCAMPAAAQRELPLKNVDVPILTYHYISTNPDPQGDPLRTGLSVTPATLEAQLDWLLQQGYTTVSLDEVYYALAFGFDLPIKPIVLTFDDGYRDFYSNAWPLIEARQMKATVYIISDYIGLPAYLTATMLQDLAASPLITVGAHTRTHPRLADLDPSKLRDQIAGSKRIIEAIIGRRIAHFCYPYGSLNDAVVAEVAAAGFVTATTTRGGRSHDLDRWRWTRLSVKGGQGLSTFVTMMGGK